MGQSADAYEERADGPVLQPTTVLVHHQNRDDHRDQEATDEALAESCRLAVNGLNLHPADKMTERVAHETDQ